MAEPFQRSDRSGSVSRLIPTRRRSNSLREIENLLASAARISEVSAEEVEAIAARHAVDLSKRFCGARKELYRRYLEHCLDDRELSSEESGDLVHLRRLLHLTDEEVTQVHDAVGGEIYGAAIDDVLNDHRLDPEEEEFLSRLRRELGLGDSTARKLYEEGERRSRQRFLQGALRHDHVFVAPQQRTLELSGTSSESLEGAVRQALEEACRALPELQRFAVTEIQGEIQGGGIAAWRVRVQARLAGADG